MAKAKEETKIIDGIGEAIQERRYRLSFTTPLLGGAPLNKAIYEKYILHDRDGFKQGEDEELDTVRDAKDDNGKPVLITGFHHDDDGIYLLSHHIKGFFKEAGNNLKDILKTPAFKSKIDNFVFVDPQYIWLKDAADNLLTRPLRAQTAMGPRVSLATSEIVYPPLDIEFKVSMLQHKDLSWKKIELLLDYGKFKGIGQWRNGTYGQFEWADITEEKKAKKAKAKKAA